MRIRISLLSTIAFLALSAPSFADLLTCGKCMGTSRESASGLGSSNANITSIVTKADVKDYCENWEGTPEGISRCLSQMTSNDVGTRETASADCPAGKIHNVDGKTYTLAGVWGRDEPTGVAAGIAKFRHADGSVVTTDHASGGRELATNFGLLCPGVELSATVRNASLVQNETGEVLGEPFNHNGSTVTIAHHDGMIVYAQPKRSIRDSVKPGTVLFRGDMASPNRVTGTAYTFKKGCAPAPYAVSGKFAGGEFSGTLTLKGKAPVRSKSGCAVTGYSATSGNARLVFDHEAPPEL